MLISEDLDFAYLVRMLKERRYSFLLCQRNPRASKFFSAARHAWRWPKLLSDGKPLQMDEACTSPAGETSILNLSSHPNSYDNQGRFILVIWDFENCCIPRTVNPSSISWKIREYLDYHGYFGRVIIRAYGDTNLLSPRKLEALSKEIGVIHVDPGNDAADKRIMVDLPFLARNNMSAGTFMLISGDSDFIHLVCLLVQSGLKFVHCNPKGRASAFGHLADRVCNWPDIVDQNPSEPLLVNAASASHPSDNSISNVIPFQSSTGQQTGVPEKHLVCYIMFIILAIAELLLVGASKPLPPILFLDCVEGVAVLATLIFLLDDLGVITLFDRERRSTYTLSENAGVRNGSLTGAMLVLGLIVAYLRCLQEIKRLELWLSRGIVELLLSCLPLPVLAESFGILKYFRWRVLGQRKWS